MQKLRIIKCDPQDSGPPTPRSGDENIFEVSINPESFSQSYGIDYTGTDEKCDKRAMNKSGATPRFKSVEPEKLSFKIMLDGTGVVPATVKGGQVVKVADQISKLRRIAYEYDGGDHQPPPVQVIWGKGLKAFFGRLKKLNVNYTLFHPDGSALRAELSLDFVEALSKAEEAKQANNQSPDLTHLVRVRAGDTLPLLCERIYRDPAKYLEIARINDLDGFRALEPDTLLRFPPMR